MPPDQPADRQPERQDSQQTDPGRAGENRGDRGRRTGGRFSAWLASAAVRLGLTVIGVVVLVFALGQAVGVDLLEMFAEALSSQTGRWLVVAFFAVLLIAAAQRGIAYRN